MGIARVDNNFTVDGTPIYAPSVGGLKVDHENIVSSDSGRMESGYMHIEWVRRDVRKVYLTYDVMTGNEKQKLHDLMQGKEFTFTYLDNGEKKSMSGYCGKMTYEMYTNALYASEGGMYQNVQVNVEEI